MIKEKYKQLFLYFQLGEIRAITIHNRCAICLGHNMSWNVRINAFESKEYVIFIKSIFGVKIIL